MLLYFIKDDESKTQMTQPGARIELFSFRKTFAACILEKRGNGFEPLGFAEHPLPPVSCSSVQGGREKYCCTARAPSLLLFRPRSPQ